MKAVVVGTGYVGLVTGACLADAGVSVSCIDNDAAKIDGLNDGVMPIFEPGLAEVVAGGLSRGRLRFSTSLVHELRGADVVFICVGTPPTEDGSADLRHVETVAHEIGRHLEHYAVVVTKSTVPVGTATTVRRAIEAEMAERGAAVEFDVASNPEFLKEGAAVADFQRPDRIVVGVGSDRAKAVLSQIYRPFVMNGHPLQFMDVVSAELTKYAANAMLATRISFMNLIARFCEETGADIAAVRQGMASDPRIGSQFLYAGVGYGGSCFPKDVRAIVRTGQELGIDVSLLEAVESVNGRQKLLLVEAAEQALGSLAGRRIAVWGLAFKPNTDDVREAPAIEMISALSERGASVVAYDPVAADQARLLLGARCAYASDPYEAVEGADALILVTEWNEFRNPDVEELAKRMVGRLVLDGRNVLDPDLLESHGFVYRGIGRPRTAGR